MLNFDFDGIKNYLSAKGYDIVIDDYEINPALTIFRYFNNYDSISLIENNRKIEHYFIPLHFVKKDNSFKELLSLYELLSKKYTSKRENDYVISIINNGYTINPKIITSPTGNCQIASISYLNYIRTEFDNFTNLTPLQKKYWFSLFILNVAYFHIGKRLFYFDAKLSESSLSELLGASEIITSSTITTTNGSIMKTGIILC